MGRRKTGRFGDVPGLCSPLFSQGTPTSPTDSTLSPTSRPGRPHPPRTVDPGPLNRTDPMTSRRVATPSVFFTTTDLRPRAAPKPSGSSRDTVFTVLLNTTRTGRKVGTLVTGVDPGTGVTRTSVLAAVRSPRARRRGSADDSDDDDESRALGLHLAVHRRLVTLSDTR